METRASQTFTLSTGWTGAVFYCSVEARERSKAPYLSSSFCLFTCLLWGEENEFGFGHLRYSHGYVR